VLLVPLGVQLVFFADQLHYLARNGGVPESLLDRSYGGLVADRAALAGSVGAAEVWVEYAGPSPIMNEALAYMFRHAAWGGLERGRSLIRYRPPWLGPSTIEPLRNDVTPPPSASRVRPWSAPQQVGGRVLAEPGASARGMAR
jgi:hypothetical protein